ncbi:hypothetical protein EUX98_g5553 [Antrodiella citrinella]|uniref:non-specific serine/threonine protein kinase n=1 Tax=Antrodiella citrinella TaxID=2447956 RepID=A0A4S4MU11_9APHY|nr:hypothetical protein EUX98_g5553 [Antrodiella citrinella]
MSAKINILFLGATGYIGGSVLDSLLDHPKVSQLEITAFVHSEEKAKKLNAASLGVKAISGPLSTLEEACANVDVVFNTASADDLPLTEAILAGARKRLANGKPHLILIHTSGTGVVSDNAMGEHPGESFDDLKDEATLDNLPVEKWHRNVDIPIAAAHEEGIVKAYIIAPSLIWGLATGRFVDAGLQNPVLTSLKFVGWIMKPRGIFGAVGPQLNAWTTVEIHEVSQLYMILFTAVVIDNKEIAGGKAYYFAGSDDAVAKDFMSRMAVAMHKYGALKTAEITPFTPDEIAAKRAEDEELRPYVIVSDLGKGSFATVYRGYHEQTHDEVAIKTVNRSGLTQKLFENLQGEIEILKALSHRHITKLLDIVQSERNVYLIIEFCAGGDLSNYIKKRGRVEGLEYVPSPGAGPTYYPHPPSGGLNEIVVRSFLRQLARALKFLRHRNLIHRDIKPQNLLLTPAPPEELARGHPLGVPILKVADFGFARSLPQAMMAETLCGSPLYMAPEILRYEKYDAKADLWSVGAVLYEMAVGKPPFRAQNHIELIKKIDSSKGVKFPDEDAQLVAKKQAEGEELKPVPSDVKKLIRSLLKRLPAERSSFDDFFGSTALARSKFPRPSRDAPPAPVAEDEDTGSAEQSSMPEHHRVIPPEVLDPKAMIPPSRFNFRKRDVGDGSRESNGIAEVPRSPVRVLISIPDDVTTKAASGHGSAIPGETDEDGLLRREYVLVDDRQAVEINRAVDEIHAARRRPLKDRKSASPAVEDQVSPVAEYPAAFETSEGAGPISFPPPPNPNAPQLSSSPSSVGSRTASNALTRALNLASKKLFGSPNARTSPHYRDYTTSSSPRRQQILSSKGVGLGLDFEGIHDPSEDGLLAALEEMAQKTEVLTHWADEMYEFVKAVPQKPLPDPSKFTRRDGEPERHAARRKNADIQAEYNAVTCVALYMLLMEFSQKGIDKLKKFHDDMQKRDPDGELEVSEGFDEALTWFKDHFIKCHDRAAQVKTWLPAQYAGPPTFLDQLVYDRALHLSRTAARKELLDQATAPDECEKLYEESLWCLYALQDDLLQSDNPFMEEDRTTIATWIKRTKLRLVRCRVRMGMTDRERLKDARLDKNLDDVPRDPAPWDIEQISRRNSSSRPPSVLRN